MVAQGFGGLGTLDKLLGLDTLALTETCSCQGHSGPHLCVASAGFLVPVVVLGYPPGFHSEHGPVMKRLLEQMAGLPGLVTGNSRLKPVPLGSIWDAT